MIDVEIDREQIEYIDGLMLGDGCIGYAGRSRATAVYSQAFAYRYKLWALRIRNDFAKFGVDSNIILRNVKCSKLILKNANDMFRDENYKFWQLRTRGDCANELFSHLKNRWYNGRTNKRGQMIKTVPPDIDLSPPQLLGNWYLGDGNYNKIGKHCILCTQGFTPQEVIILRWKLNEVLGIDAIVNKHNCIRMRVVDTLSFLDYIRDYKLNCFAYKWVEVK